MTTEMIKRLAAAPIVYSPADNCFVLPGAGRKRGLTKILRALIPIQHGSVDELDVPKARRSKNDPRPSPVVWRAPLTGRYIKQAAATCNAAIPDGPGSYHTRHGSLVDSQLKLRVEHGRKALVDRSHAAVRSGIDPCVATLLDYFEAHGERVVAAQVPLYSTEMDVATAIDVMSDRGTLYEVKSTTVCTPEAVARGDRAYETARSRLQRTALRGLPCSEYAISQVQLYVMSAMIAETAGSPPPAAAVLRVSPGIVRRYNLDAFFEARADRFRRAIGQRTGAHKRNLKRRRQQQRVGVAPRQRATSANKK